VSPCQTRVVSDTDTTPTHNYTKLFDFLKNLAMSVFVSVSMLHRSLDNQKEFCWKSHCVHVRSKLCSDANGVNVKERHYKKMLGSLGYISATPPDMIFGHCMSQPTYAFQSCQKGHHRYLHRHVQLNWNLKNNH